MREIIKPGIVLFLISMVAAVALGFVHKVTEGPIAAQREAQFGLGALKEYVPSATNFEEIEPDPFEKIDRFVVAYENNQEIGYLVNATVKGYGGDIEMMTILNGEDQVDNVILLTHAETPGLGSNAEKPEFTGQYQGKAGPFTVVKGGASGENDIESVASATITSSAVTQGVNRAVDALVIYRAMASGDYVAPDPNASPFSKLIPSATNFEELDSGKFKDIDSFTVAYENSNEVGYIGGVTVKGFGGDILLLVALDGSGNVSDIQVQEHSETPGLGAKIEEAEYVDKYRGKSGLFRVVTGAAQGENDVEAIAGATITTDVVTVGVNNVLSAWASYKGVELDVPEPVEEEPQEEAAPVSMQEYFPSATKFEEVSSGGLDGIDSFTVAYANDRIEGYIAEVTGKGFAGELKLQVVLNGDGQIQNVVLVSHSETPGLGSKAEDSAYLDQYKGKSGAFTVVKGAAASANDIEAIASATITSEAVTKGVNQALSAVSAHGSGDLGTTEAGEEGAEAVESEAPQAEASPFQKYVPSATNFEEVSTGADGVKSFTIASANGQDEGYIASVSAKGFAGPIDLLVILDKNGQVQNVILVSHSETPGLGSKAEEPAFLGQYQGKSGPFTVAAGGANDIEAIASATVTSEAVTAGVNSALSAYQNAKGAR